jgi:hypothetical protein
MKINRILLSILTCATLLGLGACQKGNGAGGNEAVSADCFFIEQQLAYNLTSNPTIIVPVARLAKAGEAVVNVSSTGSSLFTVPSSVKIESGDRIGEMELTYDPKSLTFNETYELDITISDFQSIYGYEKVHVIIEYPTSYFEYGSGTIYEDWWGEQEDKTMFVREYAENVYQCYLPECWGHDSGAGYPVQDYVFFWNTKTNKVYVPFQFMGCEDWCIADQGAIACMFGGPGYKEGSADWMAYIDKVYATHTYPQPHYDPAKKAFYLSDSAACSPADGSVSYGTPGRPDVFYLE